MARKAMISTNNRDTFLADQILSDAAEARIARKACAAAALSTRMTLGSAFILCISYYDYNRFGKREAELMATISRDMLPKGGI
jgi:hypothetical protein